MAAAAAAPLPPLEDQVLVSKLAELNASAASIEILSAWFIYHRRHCKQLVSSWAGELSKAPAARKLAFVFLASDVVQTSRKKGNDFVEAFAKALPGALRHVLKHEPACAEKLKRLVGVWEERRTFGVNRTLRELKQAVGLEVGEEGAAPASATETRAALDTAFEQLTKAQAVASESAAAAAELLRCRRVLVSVLRSALASSEEALASEAAAAERAATAEAEAREAPAAAPAPVAGPAEAAYDPAGDVYDPGDSLLEQVPQPPPTQTPMAAVQAAFAGLPSEQREFIGAALAAAASAAAQAEGAGWQQPEGEPASKRMKPAEDEV